MTDPKRERPLKTPDGFDFPYSHFGDPVKRTELLKDIARILRLNPQTVVNVGSGYDITPSDAFPNARVVHVDIAPDIVQFLSGAGFESYSPDDLPDLESDLSISVLGGDPHSVALAPEGTVLKTGRYLPEDMAVSALVTTSEPPVIVTDTAEMERLWYEDEGSNIHLVAMQRIVNQ